MRKLLTLMLLLIPISALAQPIETVRKVRSEYPATVSDPQIGAMTKEVARRLGPPYGILQKKEGRNCESYSCDVICIGNGTEQVQIDLWEKSSQGIADPSWQVIDRTRMRRDICDIVGVVTPPPPPPPPPTASCDLTDVNARLDLILEAIGKIQAAEDVQAQQSKQQSEKLDAAIAQATSIIQELQKGVKAKPDRTTQLLAILAGVFGAVGAAK